MAANTLEARLSPPHALPRVKRDQHRRLEEHFRESRNPTETDIMIIAAEIGISEREARVWYEHRLALWRKQQGLPANGGHVND
jgi:hypothetical protein